MPYDLSLDGDSPQKKKRGSAGCSFALWFGFLVVAVLVVMFGWRVFTYYGQIRRGELVDLPQFQSRLTTVSGSAATEAAAAPVDRAELESTADPNAEPNDGPAPADAKLTIVQFADFECPYSKEESTIVRTMMAKYGDRVRFVYRDFPLDAIHPNAAQAALAGECAREQGKFWAYHDKLYVNSPVLDFQSLVRYAEEAGMDRVQFERCLTDARYQPKVDADRAFAQRLGLQGTPTFFFNGQRVEGAIPAENFDALIQRFLR